jgi:hypothetical protein
MILKFLTDCYTYEQFIGDKEQLKKIQQEIIASFIGKNAEYINIKIFQTKKIPFIFENIEKLIPLFFNN